MGKLGEYNEIIHDQLKWGENITCRIVPLSRKAQKQLSLELYTTALHVAGKDCLLLMIAWNMEQLAEKALGRVSPHWIPLCGSCQRYA